MTSRCESGKGVEALMTMRDVRVRGFSKCLDVTKVLLQPVRFCAKLARLVVLQSGNSPAFDEWAEAVWRNGFQ
jgi:hypothetical protein